MKTVFLGTSEFAATVLGRLAAGEHPPVLVVTPPDRRRGRGRRLSPTAVAAAAEERGIEVLRTESTEDPEALERIRAANADAGVVCAFGQLIREPLLSELELLNVHPSLLPRWRGAAPIERAIMAGDERTGVAIMRVTAGLDSGPVAMCEAVDVAGRDFGELSGALAAVGGELAERALGLLAAGELELTEQDDSAATYAEKIDPAERRLDPSLDAKVLERTVRALSPHIVAYLMLEGEQRLGVLAARAQPGELAAGELEGGDSQGLRLGCATGTLELLSVRPPGGREMEASAYLRGHPVPRLA